MPCVRAWICGESVCTDGLIRAIGTVGHLLNQLSDLCRTCQVNGPCRHQVGIHTHKALLGTEADPHFEVFHADVQDSKSCDAIGECPLDRPTPDLGYSKACCFKNRSQFTQTAACPYPQMDPFSAVDLATGRSTSDAKIQWFNEVLQGGDQLLQFEESFQPVGMPLTPSLLGQLHALQMATHVCMTRRRARRSIRPSTGLINGILNRTGEAIPEELGGSMGGLILGFTH